MTEAETVAVPALAMSFFACRAPQDPQKSRKDYIFNDLTDIASDRHHPHKRRRPLAAGTVSIPRALSIGLALVLGGFGVSALTQSPTFTAMLAAYSVITLIYSYYLKRKLFIDVLLLAGLYTFRVIMGGAATEIVVSHWLLAFSVFFFLSLAFAKRYCELIPAERQLNKNRGYRAQDIALIGSLGPNSGYIAVLVFSLYINAQTEIAAYARPEALWALCPLLLYWITRIWFLAHRGELHEDALVFAAKDRVSYLIVALSLTVLLIAKF